MTTTRFVRWLSGVVALAAVAALGCTGEPISKRVQAGSTVMTTLVGLRGDLPVGFGSLLGGADPVRGNLRIVLCRMPGCDPAVRSPIPQGFRARVIYATRVQADRTSRNGLTAGDRMVQVFYETDVSGPERPDPGLYFVEPRVALPSGGEVLIIRPDFVRQLEIIPGDGTPSLLAASPPEEAALRGAVPSPAISVVAQQPADRPRVAAAEVVVAIPAAKVRILGLSMAPMAAVGELVQAQEADAVRILFVRKSVPTPSTGVEVIAELPFELQPGTTSSVAAGEFKILRAKLFDEQGNTIEDSARVSLGGIF